MRKLKLKAGRDFSARAFHPWIFSGALGERYTNLSDGDVVEVYSAEDTFLGVAHYYDSSIALKILSFEPTNLDADFWQKKIEAAFQARIALGLVNNPRTSAYRLVNSEGDGLPGLIVDIYNRTAVIELQSLGMARLQSQIGLALEQVLGFQLDAIYVRGKRVKGNAVERGSYLKGSTGADNLILEHGHRFEVDWEQGQKTGFFLDQRENRQIIANFARGRSVLNCFSYNGGFSVYALAADAEYVESVDSSQAALQAAERNVEFNFEGSAAKTRHQIRCADCFEYLQTISDKFNLIILDPPAFVKKRPTLKAGLKGYHTINSLAAKHLQRGDILCTFSCSQHVSLEIFSETVHAALASAGKRARLVQVLQQSACHLTSIHHPEGRYLKGLLLMLQ